MAGKSTARLAVAGGLVAFGVAAGAIGLTHSSADLNPPFPRSQAVAAASQHPYVHEFLARNAADHSKVIPLDDDHWRVTWWDGPRQVLDAAVGAGGQVDSIERHPDGSHPPGTAALWRPPILILFAALFWFAVAVEPTPPPPPGPPEGGTT